MKLNNIWIVNAVAEKCTETKNGYWLSSKGVLSRDYIYKSDSMKFDCYISKALYNSKPFDYYKPFKLAGKICFDKESSYFLTEHILN